MKKAKTSRLCARKKLERKQTSKTTKDTVPLAIVSEKYRAYSASKVSKLRNDAVSSASPQTGPACMSLVLCVCVCVCVRVGDDRKPFDPMQAKKSFFFASVDMDVTTDSPLTRLAMAPVVIKVSCFKKTAGQN